jgi:hypothetical protein
MRWSFHASMTALAASLFVITTAAGALAQANNAAEPPTTGWMQHWAVDREALLDAKLGGLKAGLRLTPIRKSCGRHSNPRCATPRGCGWSTCRA